jgi:hypothetical protein
MAVGALPCYATHMAVVVDKANTTGTVTSAQLVKLLQTDQKTWPGGQHVTIVMLVSADTEIALQKLFKVDPTEVRNFMAAHKSSIVTVDSDAALLKIVEGTPGAVGLVDVYSITSRVNVLKIDGKLPLEQGYLLH